MQVYLSEHIAPSAYARLARHFEIVDNFDHPEQLAAMIIRRAVVPRAVIARAPNLKVIAMHGVSRDTIDTAAAAEYGVPVPNVPGLGAPAVAELAVADLLALNRQLKFVNNGLCAGRFDHFGAEEFVCHEMTGRTLGLVGGLAVNFEEVFDLIEHRFLGCEVRCAELLRPLEHQVFEIVRQSGGLGRVVLAAHVHGDVGLDARRLLVDAHIDFQPVVQGVDFGVQRIALHCFVLVLRIRTSRGQHRCDDYRKE